ncbi:MULTISPECIES: Spy/CpxP family protein refolding chaperone [Nostocales]|uniref:P pilus assembly/Cpx signaling pathway, periplasmic inhibitor/zinc-resistance associated protein n=3 Tax=Nostocales TaxID=1161 RepID=A0A0C1N7N5_9CYAN|nr:P pilus assembly/Cpx signaling pathway, periplasmic inhibitor/zinc-resistance associated protein [Tolypothrix bouteillei]KAF3883910.1 P pilus assembly/Cpx signaling pathway, periplasmic inhibitor/zinc-resistance associated protein [Tolypothrix bouteillei VB521301]
MKIKHLSLIAGAIALTLTATSWAVNAETLSSSPFVVAQEQPRDMKGKGPWAKLGLTDAQKTQLQEIRRNTREEIDKILTEEQRARLKNAMENRDGKRGGWRSVMNSLNLSDEQKTQIREVKRAQRTKMEAILTDEQKAQLDEYKKQRRDRIQQYRQNQQ